MNKINIDNLREIDEFKSIITLYNEGKKYLESFDWCKNIINSWYDFGIYDKLGVFLFNIEPANLNVDDYIWIIVGDLPTVYLDKSIQTGLEALQVYCDLMDDWADNIKNGKSIDDSFPIPVEPTIENANLLKSRIDFLRQNFIKKK